jgi:hypothetical protein
MNIVREPRIPHLGITWIIQLAISKRHDDCLPLRAHLFLLFPRPPALASFATSETIAVTSPAPSLSLNPPPLSSGGGPFGCLLTPAPFTGVEDLDGVLDFRSSRERLEDTLPDNLSTVESEFFVSPLLVVP